MLCDKCEVDVDQIQMWLIFWDISSHDYYIGSSQHSITVKKRK